MEAIVLFALPAWKLIMPILLPSAMLLLVLENSRYEPLRLSEVSTSVIAGSELELIPGVVVRSPS